MNPIIHENICLQNYKESTKSILVVVHNQLAHLKNLVESLEATTQNYQLLIWDNASNQETKAYIESVADYYYRSDTNLGFIKPNNSLAEVATGQYLILLNSDCYCRTGWDKALIGYLQENPNVALTGYQGALMNQRFEGQEVAYGSKADYVCGWCCCISKADYEKFGLFDAENLQFAECEDADLSFRIKEGGREIYVNHLDLVSHFGARTFQEVQFELDLKPTFVANHAYLWNRWGKKLVGNS